MRLLLSSEGGSRRDSKKGRDPGWPGLFRRLLRWAPVLALTVGFGLTFSGWFPVGDARDIAQVAFGVVVGLIVGMEVRDGIAARRPGMRPVVSVCSCHAENAALRAEVAEIRSQADLLVETMHQMCDAAGVKLSERPVLKVVQGKSSAPVA